jgi:hypothetical protein
MKFAIEVIDNGYLVKGEFGWVEDPNGDLIDDFTLFAHTYQDALSLIANKCDKLVEDFMSKPTPQEDQEHLF